MLNSMWTQEVDFSFVKLFLSCIESITEEKTIRQEN